MLLFIKWMDEWIVYNYANFKIITWGTSGTQVFFSKRGFNFLKSFLFFSNVTIPITFLLIITMRVKIITKYTTRATLMLVHIFRSELLICQKGGICTSVVDLASLTIRKVRNGGSRKKLLLQQGTIQVLVLPAGWLGQSHPPTPIPEEEGGDENVDKKLQPLHHQYSQLRGIKTEMPWWVWLLNLQIKALRVP